MLKQGLGYRQHCIVSVGYTHQVLPDWGHLPVTSEDYVLGFHSFVVSIRRRVQQRKIRHERI